MEDINIKDLEVRKEIACGDIIIKLYTPPTMSIYILVKWSLFQIKDRGETKNIANKHLFRLTAASCKPLSVKQ